jgi:hypothetical protein
LYSGSALRIDGVYYHIEGVGHIVKHFLLAVPLLAALVAAQACNGYRNAVAPLEPGGSYVATEFTTTVNGVTVDRLAEGVTLTITLNPDGTTTGSLQVPLAGTDPVDLSGTWSLDGTVVTFSQPALTFISFLEFEVTANRLHGEGTVGPTTFDLTLTR